MTDTTTELAQTISEIFNHMGWIWGLGLGSSPEFTPDEEQIAEKINQLRDKPPDNATLVSDGRIVLATHNTPRYENHVRVLLDIGELPR